MSAPKTRPVLVAFDPITFQSYRVGLSASVAELDDPGMVAAMIGSAAATVGREWSRRFGFWPQHRIAWRVRTETVGVPE